MSLLILFILAGIFSNLIGSCLDNSFRSFCSLCTFHFFCLPTPILSLKIDLGSLVICTVKPPFSKKEKKNPTLSNMYSKNTEIPGYLPTMCLISSYSHLRCGGNFFEKYWKLFENDKFCFKFLPNNLTRVVSVGFILG